MEVTPEEEVIVTNQIDPVMLEFELEGLLAEALKLVLGNPDVITALSGFAIFITLCLVSIEIYRQYS